MDGHNEKVSLLESGGGPEPIQAVQGGGGRDDVSLLDSGGGQEPLQAVQGGGQLDLGGLAGVMGIGSPVSSGSAAVGSITDPIGTLFNAMPLTDKVSSIQQAIATQMIGTQAGLNSDQISEIIVNSTLKKSQDAIREKYGIPQYDVDPATQATIDQGTAGEQQAARDAMTAYDADPKNRVKSTHDQSREKSATILDAVTKYKEDPRNKPLFVPMLRTKLKGKVVEYKTRLLPNINRLKTVNINREEYVVDSKEFFEDNKRKIQERNVIAWMASMSTQSMRYFPLIVKKYIELNRHNWTQTHIEHRMKTEYPVVFEKDLPEIRGELQRNVFSRSNYYSRFVSAIPYTTKLFVVVPPIRGKIETLTEVLITLQRLNVISYVRGDKKTRWQLAKDLVLVFSHPYYKYEQTADRKEVNKKLFSYAVDFELENRQRVFFLSDGGSAALVRVGLYDICNCDDLDSSKHIKSPKVLEYFIPTLLSPTHVVFPYQTNTMDGILIAGEEEIPFENLKVEANPFMVFRKGPLYGKMQAITIKKNYPLSVANSNVCAVRMDAALNRFRIDTKNFGGDITALIVAHIQPLVAKIVDVCNKAGANSSSVGSILLSSASNNPKLERGEFIIKTEAMVKIKKDSVNIIKSITTDAALQEKIQKVLADYVIDQYDKYLRFPFTNEVNYIREKESGVPIVPMAPIVPVQVKGKKQVGGGIDCLPLRVEDSTGSTTRMRTLGLFDRELYLTDDILFLHLNKDYQKCLPHIKREVFNQVDMNEFRQHKEDYEISNKYDFKLIDVGGRMFEIRVPSADVIDNWAGRTQYIQAGGQMGETTSNMPSSTSTAKEGVDASRGEDNVIVTGGPRGPTGPSSTSTNNTGTGNGWNILDASANTLTDKYSTATLGASSIASDLQSGSTNFGTVGSSAATSAVGMLSTPLSTSTNNDTNDTLTVQRKMREGDEDNDTNDTLTVQRKNGKGDDVIINSSLPTLSSSRNTDLPPPIDDITLSRNTDLPPPLSTVTPAKTTTTAPKEGLSLLQQIGIGAAGVAALGLIGSTLFPKSSGASSAPTYDRSSSAPTYDATSESTNLDDFHIYDSRNQSGGNGTIGSVLFSGSSAPKPGVKSNIYHPVKIGQRRGNESRKIEHTLPILIEGEADLLNSLHLQPKDLDVIFNETNKYGIKSWRTAIPAFFSNLLASKCYKDAILLTSSECQDSRNFLYSIDENTEKEQIEKDNNPEFDSDSESESEHEHEHKHKHKHHEEPEHLKKVIQEEKLEDIVRHDGVQELSVVMPGRPIPTFNVHSVDNVYYPSVKAMAVDKNNGTKRLLNIYLKGFPVKHADSKITDDHKSKLATKIFELQQKYTNYVIYTY